MGKIRERVINATSHMELVGICEANPDLRKQSTVPTSYEAYKDMLKSDIDIIFVCTPNALSPEIVIESLRHGKHVFAEKPPGRTLDDIKRIIQVEVECKGQKLMFGFNHRYHPGIAQAKECTKSGDFGKIMWLRGTYGKSGGENFDKSWKNNVNMSGGGILLDQGIHMIDLMRYFCGEFESVKGFMSRSFWNFEIEDNAFALLRTPCGQVAALHSSSTLWKHTFRLEIFLEKGYLIVSGLLSKTGSYGREMLTIGKRQFESESFALGNPREEIIYFDQDRSWDLEVAYFTECIQENKKIENSSSYDALKAMELVERIYKDDNISYGLKSKERM